MSLLLRLSAKEFIIGRGLVIPASQLGLTGRGGPGGTEGPSQPSEEY
jgi:hypothetical protein